MKDETLIVNEIFMSINGEVTKWHQGSMACFIRLAGCNLSCSYCDTPYALDVNAGKSMTMIEIEVMALESTCRNITITGGEPLIQKQALKVLIKRLIRNGHKITIETNGTIPIHDCFTTYPACDHLCWVVDYKLDKTQEMISRNYDDLAPTDFIKFLISDIDQIPVVIARSKEMHKNGVRANFAISIICDPQTKQFKIKPMSVIRDLFIFGETNFILNFPLHKTYLDNTEKEGIRLFN